MSLFYFPDDENLHGKYGFSYQELRDDYRRYALMSDEEFLARIVDVLHFACYVAYVKELQTQWVLSDTGVIHELIHLLCEERNKGMGIADYQVTTTPLEKIRDIFNRDCCLA